MVTVLVAEEVVTVLVGGMAVVVVAKVVLILVVLVVVVVKVVVAVLVVRVVIVEAVVAVVVKGPVGTGGVIDTLVGVLVIDVLINAVNTVEITLEFSGAASCSMDVLSDGAILLMDTVAGVRTVVNVNMFAGVMTVTFVMPAPLEEFSC